MTMNRKKLAVIHVAKKQLGLCDEDYRAILRNYGGVESSRDLDKESFKAVMFRFEMLGFVSDWNKEQLGRRPGMATPDQVALIRALWRDYTGGEGTARQLDKWLSHHFGVDSIRFLDSEEVGKPITALKKMTARKKAA